MLTGDLIEAYHRQRLTGSQLSAWAVELVVAGKDSESIIRAAANPGLPPEHVGVYFRKILKELQILDHLDDDIAAIKKKVFLEEYRKGLRPGAQVLKIFDDLRREIGFPSQIAHTILGDDYRGNERAGYHTLDRKLHGDLLEKEIRRYLERAGKI
jgi:hypothetical protein